MTLIIEKPTGAKLNLRKGWQPMDTDAAAYITAVETADGQVLEEKTKIAIDNFVLGCKADGIWSAIKASCILAGARTLTGALVPLVGTAPTNFNFVAGDYNRKTGLVGNGSTKYLSSNRNNNADPQNSRHVAIYASTMGAGNIFNSGPASTVGRVGLVTDGFAGCNNDAGAFTQQTAPVVGFSGLSRGSSNNYIYRTNLSNTTVSINSGVPNNGNTLFYARPGTPPDLYATSRLAFYSIGESLNLALLDARVTDLINAIGAAIP
jgi:hypothetical protein